MKKLNKAKFAIQSESTKQVYSTDEEYVARHQLALLRSLNNDIDSRKAYGDIMLNFTIVWLFSVVMIFTWTGLGKLHYSDPVLITMITTTTSSALGFLIIVFNYLYKNK